MQTILPNKVTIQSIRITFVIIATSKDIVSPGPTENVSSACSDLAKQYDQPSSNNFPKRYYGLFPSDAKRQ